MTVVETILLVWLIVTVFLLLRILVVDIPDIKERVNRVQNVADNSYSNTTALEKYLGIRQVYNGYKYVKLTAKERKENYG